MAITINNSANISYNSGTLTDYATSNIATTQLAENYSLNVSKTSLNTSWRPSENLTFTIRVENDGEEPLFGVTIQDNLGGNTNRLLTYIEGSATMLRNDVLTGITPTSVEPLTLAIPDTLAVGEVIILNYIAKVRSDIDINITEITNELTVSGHETSISGPTITVTPNPTITLSKASYADVTIQKTVDKENISVGDNLTYTFILENSGNIEATNVVIQDELPENFVIDSVTSETNGVQTIFEPTDYSLDETNKLILPTSVTKTISVPASTLNQYGVTRVIIVGSITA